MARKDKGGISGPFIPLHKDTIENPAWKEMSFGAQCLFIALTGHAANKGCVAYLSYRKAAEELGCRGREVVDPQPSTTGKAIEIWICALELHEFEI